MTLEEAQNKIIELNETIASNETLINSLNESVNTYKNTIDTKENEISKLKEYNMNLFLKVSQDQQHITNSDNSNTDNEVKSWDDFEFKC